MASWTPTDQQAAIHDGWLVLADGIGGYRIIRCFGKSPFTTDTEAVDHIRKQAKSGSDIHRRALVMTHGK